MSLPSVDILAVNFNTAHLLGEMLEAVKQASAGVPVRCLIIDNASSDDSLSLLAENYPEVQVVANRENVGFGRANNRLLECFGARYALLLNTDAFVSPDTLAATLAYMEAHPECGVLGVRLVGRDGEMQPSCRYFPTPLNVFLARTGLGRFMPWVKAVDDLAWDHASVRECDWVPGCYYLVRREVIERIGLFDPRFFLYYEEVDHCRRVKAAGWKVVYFPHSVVHLGGESAKSAGELTSHGRQLSALQIESELLYFRKHYGRSGLAWHLCLVLLGEAVLALKAILKGRTRQVFPACWRNLRATWRLLRATRFATRPTR